MNNKQWEEEFDNKFNGFRISSPFYEKKFIKPKDEIKNFISALLKEREAEIRKETIKAVLQLFDKYEGTDFKVKLNELYEMD